MRGHILLGTWSEDELQQLISQASRIDDPGIRIEFLSRRFLDTPYGESTLIGSNELPEVLTVDFSSVDCLTFIEYVEAMRRSRTADEFMTNLLLVRYASAEVSYRTRNHFFTDWLTGSEDYVSDVTESIGTGIATRVSKKLNQRADGSLLLPGVPCRRRQIVFVSVEKGDAGVVERLRTGDYIGIYSERAELDVSHVGILVRDNQTLHIRHASSPKRHGKVIDEDFWNYMADRPGFIVIRARGGA